MPQLDLVFIQVLVYCVGLYLLFILQILYRYTMGPLYLLDFLILHFKVHDRFGVSLSWCHSFMLVSKWFERYTQLLVWVIRKESPFYFNFSYLRQQQKNISFLVLKEHILYYPTPINFNYMWSFGSLSGLYFVIQLVTGILLAMHYTPHMDFAFDSVEHIMRDLNFGWLIRYLHANGASFFFIMVYCHMGKAFYFFSLSSPYAQIWRVGVLIFLLMILTAFLGYVLPWGQMSFWGATVITNLLSAIPIIGEFLVFWLWGGFAVENPTLNRFYSLHYLLPFIIMASIMLHLSLLHIPGSSHPLKSGELIDKITFYPYFYLKDLLAFFVSLVSFCFFVFFQPNFLGHPDNYILANPLATPSHIVPEWYFLPFYAILRSIPNKLGGVIAMLFAIIVLFFLPNILSTGIHVKNPELRPLSRFLFWCFVVNLILLGFIGSNVVEYPYISIGQISTFFYFFYLLILLPSTVIIEQNIFKK